MLRGSNDMVAEQRNTSLLTAGVAQRIAVAVAVIAVLWLAVAWAVRNAV